MQFLGTGTGTATIRLVMVGVVGASSSHRAELSDCLRFRRSSRRRAKDADEERVNLTSPQILAVRHAESVANVRRNEDPLRYAQSCWLDDSHTDAVAPVPRHEQLRDALLSPLGVASTIERGDAHLPGEPWGPGPVLLVVSPLTRTVLTAALLFRRLEEVEGVEYTVVLEPAAREVINAPHDIIEDVGRPHTAVFEDARRVLAECDAPASAVALLERIERASADVDPDWWVTRGEVPPARRVLEIEAEARRQALREAVKGHVVAETERRRGRAPSKVYIVCHWGVLWTLLKGKRGHFKNLECVDVTTDGEGEGFLDVDVPSALGGSGSWRGGLRWGQDHK